MEPYRVPNRAPEGPKWRPGGSKIETGGSSMDPVAQDENQQGAQSHHKDFREAQVPL